MTVFRNVVFVAAIAGLLAGMAMAAMQSFATVPLILQAETFENAAEPAAHQAAAGHDHGDAAAAVEAHDHSALVLVAVSEALGGIAGWRQGLVWGFAGFAVFTLAPGLGLPPELPAMPAADLVARQAWWIATVVATAGGLGLIAFSRSLLPALAGVALIVAPHVVGAPQPVSHDSPVPAGLHHEFVVAVTVTNLVFWVFLGALVGVVRQRLTRAEGGLAGRLA